MRKIRLCLRPSRCYPRISEGNNAGFQWPPYRGRQPENPTLVGPTLEGPSNVPCLQDGGLAPRSPYCKHSASRARRERKQHADLPSHHRHLQVLCSLNVLQRCANGGRCDFCARRSTLWRRVRPPPHARFAKSICHQSNGPIKEKRLIWRRPDLLPATFRLAQRCSLVTCGAS